MSRAVAPMLLSVFLASTLLFAAPRIAAACSWPGFDVIHDRDVIFAGRVVDMTLAPEEPARMTPQTVAVWVDFEVDRYLKGSGPKRLRTLDQASVTFLHGQTPEQQAAFERAAYWGSGGACGALNEDPRGQYWVTGASVREDGVVLLYLIGLIAIGDGPDDPHVIERIAAVEADVAAAGLTPAVTGHGLPDAAGALAPALTSLLATAAAVLLVLLGRCATAGRRSP